MSSKGSSKSINNSDLSKTLKSSMGMTAIKVLYNILILIYILSLEDKKCGCITDWRHDFIKYFSIALIIWGILTHAFAFGTKKNSLVSLLNNILMFGALINIWCLYTYVGDLDKTKCMCAIDTQKNMHYFLYIWRYVLVGALMLALLGVIILTLGSKTM